MGFSRRIKTAHFFMPELVEIDPQNIVHVVPVNDLALHTTQCVFRPIGLPFCPCLCGPEHKEQPPSGMVIVHNSFDGREGVEWANEILQHH